MRRKCMSLQARAAGRLLHLANADPPGPGKEAFYGLKDRILAAYGLPTGECDLQHVRKECFTCEGTGRFEGREMCRRCLGSGVFDEFWTLLAIYTVGGYRFHKPMKRYSRRELKCLPSLLKPTIEGYVEHKRPPRRAGFEAACWLALFFDRRLLWKWLWVCRVMYRPRGFWQMTANVCAFLKNPGWVLLERRLGYQWRGYRWRVLNRELILKTCLLSGDGGAPF